MGPAIIRFINRLNIQTSWLRETDTRIRFLSWQQDTSQLGTRRSSGMGSWVSNNYTQAQREFSFWLRCSPGFLCSDDSLCSRCRRVPAPSFPVEVTTAADAQRAVGILVLSLRFSQGRGNGRSDSRKQRAWQDSRSWRVHRSSDRMRLTRGKVDGDKMPRILVEWEDVNDRLTLWFCFSLVCEVQAVQKRIPTEAALTSVLNHV